MSSVYPFLNFLLKLLSEEGEIVKMSVPEDASRILDVTVWSLVSKVTGKQQCEGFIYGYTKQSDLSLEIKHYKMCHHTHDTLRQVCCGKLSLVCVCVCLHLYPEVTFHKRGRHQVAQ